jgi:hypothetical protein
MHNTSFTSFWISSFADLRIKKLDKRWVTLDDISSLLATLPIDVDVLEIGKSAEGRPIQKFVLGTGNKPVLAWAAMHGNESTSMRGWLDLFLNMNNKHVKAYFAPLLKEFTIHFVPLLNPDGAHRYTRRNAMDIDLNRDACAWQTPEMLVLKQQIDDIQPVLAFNLHDQRNIHAVAGKPATISFLAPSVDVERNVTAARLKAMDLIGAASKALKPFLNGQMGRYTDEYYPTAVGEFVQQRGIPAILVECGPALNDPLRQHARMANPVILHAVLQRFTPVTDLDASGYNAIPVNETNQVDILVKGIKIERAGKNIIADLALLAEHSVSDGNLLTLYKVLDFGDLQQLVALETFDGKSLSEAPNVQINSLANFTITTSQGKLQFVDGIRR